MIRNVMQHRHYEQIAEIIRDTITASLQNNTLEARRAFSSFAMRLANRNQNMDTARFLDAAGLSSSTSNEDTGSD